jgi:hypothetical protein
MNLEQTKEYNRKWYQKHRETEILGSLNWIKEHPEKVKEYRKRWRAKHPFPFREYYLKHKEEIKAKRKIYGHNHRKEENETRRKYFQKMKETNPSKYQYIKLRDKESRKRYFEKYPKKLEEKKEYSRQYCRQYDKLHPESAKARIKKYSQTLKGKALRQKCHAKRRQLGFIPLNEPFEGCEGHHINFQYVIFIPKELHRSIWHSVFLDINMDKINKLAFEYLKKNKNKTKLNGFSRKIQR